MIVESTSRLEISVYPTLTNGQVNISGLSQESSYIVYSLTGELLLTGSATQIDMTNLDSDVFIIKLINSDGSVIFTERVIRI